MEKIYRILLVTMGMGLCLAAPSTNKKITFFDAINSTCSNGTQLQQAQKEIFDSCKDFSKSTGIGQDNIFCGLYLESITSYCSKFHDSINSTLADIKHFNYTMEDVCQNIIEYSNKNISLMECFFTCLSVKRDVKPECLYAHHYNVLSRKLTTSAGGAGNAAEPARNDHPELNLSGPEAHPKANEISTNSRPPSGTAPEIQQSANPDAPIEHTAEILTNGNEPPVELPNNDNKTEKQKIQGTAEQSELKPTKPASSENNQHASSTHNVITPPNNKGAAAPPTNQNVAAPSNNQDASSLNNESVPAANGEPEGKPTKTKEDQAGTDLEEEDDGQHGIPEDGDDYTDVNALENPPKLVQEEHKEKKPDVVQENPINSENLDEVDGESYFFSYFMVVCVLFVLGYVGYHNRIKVMALLLEGKRNKRQHRGRRPNSANYHKLDSNLEEAISSNVTKNSNNVIY